MYRSGVFLRYLFFGGISDRLFDIRCDLGVFHQYSLGTGGILMRLIVGPLMSLLTSTH